MTEEKSILAVFADIDPAADAIDQLRLMGIHDDHMNVISGIPVTEAMLGRPHQWTNVPRLAGGGAVVSFALGVFLSVIAPNMYTIQVGGQREGSFPECLP